MSRASKVFLAAALAVSSGTVYGVHWLQQRESETMYQGVLRDEARVAAKAASSSSPSSTSLFSSSSSPSSSSSSSSTSSFSSSSSSSTSSVTQPAPLVDPECTTCVLSPPPQLVESQSAAQRARERDLRWAEYNAQKKVGEWAARGAGSEGSTGSTTSSSISSERLV